MQSLNEELRNKEHWESAYNRMSLKPNFSKEQVDLLWKYKEVDRQQLINEIETGTYEWNIPRKVEIAKHESKRKRVVYIYPLRDRYILGVLYRVFSTFYQKDMSNNCFSYKKQVSTSHAIQYIKKRKTNLLKYGVKMDIHAYFNSVDKDRVTELVNQLPDGGIRETIKKLMLTDRVLWKGHEIEEFKSLIPGSALGSFFANTCLKELDEYFENNDRVYARYSDDIVILGENREQLEKDVEFVQQFIGQYGLTMNPDKFQWFGCGDDVDFLGLKLSDDGTIDISDHSKFKIKKQIHRWCKKGRIEIERDGKSYYKVARNIIRRLNNKNFKCYIEHDETFGWCAYSFPRITTEESLREIDLYTKERLLALKTGRNNRANYRHLDEEELHNLGWVSLVQLYHLYRDDFDYYCEVIELL